MFDECIVDSLGSTGKLGATSNTVLVILEVRKATLSYAMVTIISHVDIAMGDATKQGGNETVMTIAHLESVIPLIPDNIKGSLQTVAQHVPDEQRGSFLGNLLPHAMDQPLVNVTTVEVNRPIEFIQQVCDANILDDHIVTVAIDEAIP